MVFRRDEAKPRLVCHPLCHRVSRDGVAIGGDREAKNANTVSLENADVRGHQLNRFGRFIVEVDI
jgi:hypothetical protein